MPNEVIPPTTSAGFSADAESAPAISYEVFERTAAPTTTSAVQPKKVESKSIALPEPPSPPAPMESRARKLLDLQRQEHALQERQRQLEAAEAQLSPDLRNQRAIADHDREAVEHVQQRRDTYPMLNALDRAAEVPAYIRAVWQRTGKVLDAATVAEAIELHYQSLYEKAAPAMRNRRSAPARQLQQTPQLRQVDWTDDRRIDDDERWRRAMAAMQAVGSRRSR